MDNAALIALVDRWRPDTHIFHLPAGEMTVTLQDVTMLFGLRIDGRAVTVPSLQLDGGILVMEFVVMCYNYLAPLLVLIVVGTNCGLPISLFFYCLQLLHLVFNFTVKIAVSK